MLKKKNLNMMKNSQVIMRYNNKKLIKCLLNLKEINYFIKN